MTDFYASPVPNITYKSAEEKETNHTEAVFNYISYTQVEIFSHPFHAAFQ